MATNHYYYSISDDIAKYPKAWAYIIIGGRNTGKTYGALKDCTENKRKHVFVKRTMDDVRILTAGSGRIGTKQKEYSVDLSPYKSLNRDIGSNIKAFSIDNGLGAFFNCDEEGDPVEDPAGYLIALSAVQKFKGFDLSDCDWMIFDEFIPQPWERVNKKEGEQVLDLYKTVSRDREHRGREPLKLICLANATEVSNPVMNVLEITDVVVDMQAKGQEYVYIEEKGILIHQIHMSAQFNQVEEQSMLYKAMASTQWGQMAYGNEFGYNDFTSVGKISLKNYMPFLKLRYKRQDYYVYWKDDGHYYMTKSRYSQKGTPEYDLNRENGQKAFYNDYDILLRNACIEGRMLFETYTMYDIIINFKKFFKV